jgi:hypothetical protein
MMVLGKDALITKSLCEQLTIALGKTVNNTRLLGKFFF